MATISSTSIAENVLADIIAVGIEAVGEQVYTKFVNSRENKKKIKEYIEKITNRVSLFITYRPYAQHVEEAFVKPLILDSALSQTYLAPEIYEEIFRTIIKDIALSDKLLAATKTQPVSLSYKDKFVYQIKYLPIEDLISKSQYCLVLGEPGSGKSALLSYVCFERLKLKKARIPIFADARELDEHDLGEHITEVLTTLGLDKKDLDWVNRMISVYVDGLDELNLQRYKEICVELSNLCREFPNLQITVSCRSAAYGGELSFLPESTLMPFDIQRIEKFIYAWFKNIKGTQSADGLITHIKSSDSLMGLSAHPLLLSLMCNAYRRYMNISRRHTALFEQCVESLLWQWDADRAISRKSKFSDLDLEKKKWIHAIIAVKLHQSKLRYTRKSVIVSTLEEILPMFGIQAKEAKNILAELCSYHGILVKLTEETYGFGHLALQEYLAAKWYASEQRWVNLATAEILYNHWWENTIALCLASLSDSTTAFESIMSAGNVDEIRRLRILATTLKYDPIVSPNVRQSVLSSILTRYHNGNSEVSRQAFDMLIGIEDTWTAAKIIKSIQSKLPRKSDLE